MCQMLGEPQNDATFSRIRTEMSEYLLQRWKMPWMHDLLVASAEIDQEDVTLYREAQEAHYCRCGRAGPVDVTARAYRHLLAAVAGALPSSLASSRASCERPCANRKSRGRSALKRDSDEWSEEV